MECWLRDQLTRPDLGLAWRGCSFLQFPGHALTSQHANEIGLRTSTKGLFLLMKTMTLQEAR